MVLANIHPHTLGPDNPLVVVEDSNHCIP
jgi:hypothetical protein